MTGTLFSPIAPLFTLVILLVPAMAADAVAKERPNIILILADDLGYGEVGCYGQRLIQTPRLDRMAAEGMRFTQFYAGASLCASSRNVLLTGEHTGHCRVRDNGHPSIQTLRPADVTLAEVLKPVGYSTAIVGKWAIGGDLPETGGRPEDQGFDFFYGYLNSVAAHNYYPEYLWRNRDKEPLGNVVKKVGKGYAGFVGGRATKRVAYSHDLFMSEALGWIREHRERPFFLLLTPTIPHANPEARKDTGNGTEVPDLGIYEGKPWTEQNKGHAAMITRLDTGVGALLDLLDELDLEERTLVIFTSDNGPHNEAGHSPEFFDANGPLREAKFSLWEGGLRVPTIMRWPGVIEPGRVSDHLGYFGDFMATFCELSGGERPTPPHGLDSVSFLPTIRGDAEAQPQHEFLYWELIGWSPREAVRFENWKAIRAPLGFGQTLLFDLSNDLSEQHNVSDKYPDVVRRAERYMDASHVDTEHWKAPPKP
ncbi:MAG: N-acetylgalactosamine-6-sulfatase [Planctomycetota bacterium]|nr:MAG: N-acetylgalactosamine-6-sulfatase [Planctomycetota bacterium]REK22185.1 MAG: N-acetylgalactosamine-6-sulfatase [Planctomycetota bacterium]REK44293.1 MAG: N-acetylgalactosamine-6-sulfatase [Planctomycetota bacterium]